MGYTGTKKQKNIYILVFLHHVNVRKGVRIIPNLRERRIEKNCTCE